MRRVYVAATGAVSGFGAGVPALCDAVFSGRSALLPLRRLAGIDCLTEVAGEVPEEFGGGTELPYRLARVAMDECGQCAGDADAFVLATTKGDLSGITGPGDGLGNPWKLAERLADGRPAAAVSCACASGLSALAVAGRWIRTGRFGRVLVVGTDSLSEFILRGFSSLLALSPGPCRPYDREREGLSLGEAAGAMLLTSEETDIELAGWGESNDANHITGPSRDGEGLYQATAAAIARAGLLADDVDYVHTHGTGTPFNDAMEARALVKLFAHQTPAVSGTKAQTGHTLGAAGVIESIIAIEALRRGEAPGNVGLAETDLDARIALTREKTPLSRSKVALKFAAGFGGINAALVFVR